MAEEGRVFVRSIAPEPMSLEEWREAQLATSRVRQFDGDDHTVVGKRKKNRAPIDGKPEDPSRSIATWNHVEPGDEPFLTQSLQVYFHEFQPHTSNRGHGHQNEAAFYVLAGAGYEVHDDLRYDWRAGDFFTVHTDSVHRHFNPYDEPARLIVVKAKPTWMFLGLIQEGESYRRFSDESGRFGEREEWGKIWTPGVLDRKKVVSKVDAEWELTPLGRTRTFSSPQRTDVRIFSVDAFEWEIPAGSRSARAWKMADEVLYVVRGSGYSLHWRVEAEMDERYYARIATEPTRHEFHAGETLYVPHNTVTQHFAYDGAPVLLFSGQNRMYKHLGYDNVHVFEPAPEFAAAH